MHLQYFGGIKGTYTFCAVSITIKRIHYSSRKMSVTQSILSCECKACERTSERASEPLKKKQRPNGVGFSWEKQSGFRVHVAGLSHSSVGFYLILTFHSWLNPSPGFVALIFNLFFVAFWICKGFARFKVSKLAEQKWWILYEWCVCVLFPLLESRKFNYYMKTSEYIFEFFQHGKKSSKEILERKNPSHNLKMRQA